MWTHFAGRKEESRKRVQLERVEVNFLGASLDFPEFSTTFGFMVYESSLESFKAARWDIFEVKGFGLLKVFCRDLVSEKRMARYGLCFVVICVEMNITGLGQYLQKYN